eukprot:Ihof_evm1s646 gene=Ihof_evmTU1s646
MSKEASLKDVVNQGIGNLPVKGIFDRVMTAVLDFTEIEIKVRDATNQDPWGPSSTDMQEIARFTMHSKQYPDVMRIIWDRIADKHWRHVYKALLLLEFLFKHGNERVAREAMHHKYDLAALSSFRYTDSKGEDRGINVQRKSKDLVRLLEDPRAMEEERRKAAQNKGKYTGISAGDSCRPSFGSASRYSIGDGGRRSYTANESAGYGGSASHYGGFDKYGRDNHGGSSNFCTSGTGEVLLYDDEPYVPHKGQHDARSSSSHRSESNRHGNERARKSNYSPDQSSRRERRNSEGSYGRDE